MAEAWLELRICRSIVRRSTAELFQINMSLFLREKPSIDFLPEETTERFHFTQQVSRLSLKPTKDGIILVIVRFR